MSAPTGTVRTLCPFLLGDNMEKKYMVEQLSGNVCLVDKDYVWEHYCIVEKTSRQEFESEVSLLWIDADKVPEHIRTALQRGSV